MKTGHSPSARGGFLGVSLLGLSTVLGLVCSLVLAKELPADRRHAMAQPADQTLPDGGCRPPRALPAGREGGDAGHALEGIQIETSDVHPFEVFFERILAAEPIMRIDHPQVDHIRGYCYRGVLVVVRHDMKTPRPSGWVQLNFSVADVQSVKQELEHALHAATGGQSQETERTVARLRFKPDVPRTNCRVARLELGGPEGFMIGFNQFKEGTCKRDGMEHSPQGQPQALPHHEGR